MTRVLLLAFALLLSACASSPDAKIANIRFQKLPSLKQELGAKGLELGAPVLLRAFKDEMVMEAWVHDRKTGQYTLFNTYEICKISGTPGPKTQQGDMQAPEGFYDITKEQLFPASAYHLAMNVGYPNEYDRAHQRTGDRLMIHGQCWSEGCFAMNNRQIEDIYLLTEQALEAGQPSVPLQVFPFRMTDEKLFAHAGEPWMDFWSNIKEGYDYFETHHVPPVVSVQQKRYIFSTPVYL